MTSHPCCPRRSQSSSCSNRSHHKSSPTTRIRTSGLKTGLHTHVIERPLGTFGARTSITGVGIRARFALRWFRADRRCALGSRGARRALICRTIRIRSLPACNLGRGADWGIRAVARCNCLAAGHVFCGLFYNGRTSQFKGLRGVTLAERHSLLENVPRGQSVHCVAPGSEYAPAPHVTRFWPSAHEYPAVQVLQRVV